MLALWCVTQSWHRYDADGSGEIELEEFREMMEVMLPAMGAEYRIYQQHREQRRRRQEEEEEAEVVATEEAERQLLLLQQQKEEQIAQEAEAAAEAEAGRDASDAVLW